MATYSIQTFQCNDFQENTYLLYTPEGPGIVIDCGCSNEGEWTALSQFLAKQRVKVELLLNTHGHIDHVIGIPEARRRWKVPFAMHGDDNELLATLQQYASMWGYSVEPVSPPEKDLAGKGSIEWNGDTIKILHTPGHTPGGICIYLEEQGVLFTGDTLFRGSVGRTDLPKGSHKQLFESIARELVTLPDETIIYPGHGPASTIGEEKAENPFLLHYL